MEEMCCIDMTVAACLLLHYIIINLSPTLNLHKLNICHSRVGTLSVKGWYLCFNFWSIVLYIFGSRNCLYSCSITEVGPYHRSYGLNLTRLVESVNNVL